MAISRGAFLKGAGLTAAWSALKILDSVIGFSDGGLEGKVDSIAKEIAEGKKQERGREYSRAYEHFMNAYILSTGYAGIEHETAVYNNLSTVALWYAANTLVSADNFPVVSEKSDKQIPDKQINLEFALLHYKDALRLREDVEKKGDSAFIRGVKEEVPSQETIRLAIAKFGPDLYNILPDSEYKQKKLVALDLVRVYRRLSELEIDPKKKRQYEGQASAWDAILRVTQKATNIGNQIKN